MHFDLKNKNQGAFYFLYNYILNIFYINKSLMNFIKTKKLLTY